MNTAADGFYEYKTVDENGIVISPASNVIKFTHSSGNKEYETILTDEQAVQYSKVNVFADAPEEFKSRVGLSETGINTIQNEHRAIADAIYTLQGVRVEKATKGIYIINGKKVVIK
jgi:ribosomal protein L24